MKTLIKQKLKLALVITFISTAVLPLCAQPSRDDNSFGATIAHAASDQASAAVNFPAQWSKNVTTDALKVLSTIDQLKPTLANLPENIDYRFSPNTPGVANYDDQENSITINLNSLDLYRPQDRLKFYVTLAHELRHANQKKEGLYYDDLKESSFGDTFRVAKMMETDTRLISAVVENELLKRKEFKDCVPSKNGEYYRQELQRANGNIATANTNFVLSYWKNATNNDWLDTDTRDVITSHYLFYTEQAYHQALLLHNPMFGLVSTKQTTPLQAMKIYVQKMGLKGISAESFLQNGFDVAQTADNFKDGVTIFLPTGEKCFIITPTENPYFDLWVYLPDRQEARIFLKNTMTGEMIPFDENKDNAVKAHKAQESARRGHHPAMDGFSTNPIQNEQDASPSALEIAIGNDKASAVAFILGKGSNPLPKTRD